MNIEELNLALPKSTIFLREGNKVLLLVPDKPDWVVANSKTAILLAMCNGSKKIKEIASCLPDDQQIEFVNLVTKLKKDNFFTEVSDEANDDKKFEDLKPHLNSIHLNMTSTCNLRCIYCYAEEREKIGTPLNKEEYKNVINSLTSFAPDSDVTFTGGEPLLNPLTVEIAELCKSRGLHTSLLSNGTLVNEENVSQIANAFDSIRFSVDGSTEEIHDRLRGEGSWRKTMHAVELLDAAGQKVSLAMTVTKLNIGEISALSKKWGSRLSFQPLYKVGRAKNKDIGMTGQEYYDVLLRAPGVQPYGKITEELARMRNRKIGRCAIGAGEISLSPSGDVFPCHMLHVAKFCAGNVRQQTLENIYFDSKILKSIRCMSVTQREECRDCPYRFLCSGGCWARTFYQAGSFLAADPFCDYDIAAFRTAFFNILEDIHEKD